MTRASRARAIAAAAAVGGAGLVGTGGAIYGLLLGQTRLARRRIGPFTDSPLDADGRYEPDSPEAQASEAVRAPQPNDVSLLVLGDSGAAGFGVEHPDHTTGAAAAQALAHVMGRPVRLQSLAVVGAQSGDLAGQIDQLEQGAAAAQPGAPGDAEQAATSNQAWPDLAVIIIGANDVTHRVTPGRSVALLAEAIGRLRTHDVEVVVGTCPDLGTVQPIPHPLRWVARRWSRSIAAAQMVASVQAGARAVALADLLGPEFDAHPERMFGPDRFHPSSEGYRAVAEALVPSMVDALTGPSAADLAADDEATALALARAAAEAAEIAGAEVSAVATGSRLRGFVRLRRRPAPDPTPSPAPNAAPTHPASDSPSA